MLCYGQGKKPLPKVSSLAAVNVITTEGKETADQVIVTQQRQGYREEESNGGSGIHQKDSRGQEGEISSKGVAARWACRYSH